VPRPLPPTGAAGPPRPSAPQTPAAQRSPLASSHLAFQPPPPPRDASAPSIKLFDTLSPESLEREGLVLDEPAVIRVNTSQDSLEGQLLAGKYRVRKLLGEGGMGEVFLAEHEAIGKQVAIKVLRSEHSQKTDVVERFRLEARSASRIQHPNVVQVFDFGQLEDGRFYLALEFLDGLDLAELLHKTRMIEPLRALYIALQLCAGLSAAHASGIIHRDMKPENVFLQPNRLGFDDVKVVDFGIAKMREISEHASTNPPPPTPEGERDRRITKAGSIFGTPEYMAPEQAAGREIDHRVDLYAVGVILYEMLTGRVPFSGASLLETLTKHITEQARPPRELNPNISPELEAAILQALAKTPGQRQPNMDALAEQLQLTPEGERLMDVVRQSGPLSFSGIPSPRRSAPVPEDTERASQAPLPLIKPARASTNLEAVSASQPTPLSQPRPSLPPGRRKALPWVLTGVVLGLLGLVVMVGMSRSRPTVAPVPAASLAAPPAESTAPVLAPTSASVVPPVAPPAASPVVSAQATPAVALHVVTVPPGAVVLKGDFQVCDASPCDLQVAPNEAVELVATRAGLRGVAKVLAQRNQTVLIRLVQPTGGAMPKPTGASSGRNVAPVPMCEFTDGDLKILRPCK
jgi:serine/threonine-protein kinase